MRPCERVMDLVVMLSQTSRPLSFSEIASQVDAYQGENVDSAKRTFERDKQTILDLGIPLECVKRSDENDLEEDAYRIDPGAYQLPDLCLDPDEHAALAVTAAVARHQGGLSHAALLDGALRKLAVASRPQPGTAAGARAQDPVDSRAGAPAGTPASAPPLAVHLPGLHVDERTREHLSRLEEAASGCKRVTLRYRAQSTGEESERQVDPYGIVYRRGCWYLVGRCHRHDAVRMFRVDRILSLAVAGRPRHPDFERPADFDLAGYAHVSPWTFALGEQVEVVLEIDRELAAVAAEDFGPGAVRSAGPRGGQRVRFRCGNLPYLVTRVLAAADRLRVLEPEAVRARIRETASAIVAVYRGAAGVAP